MEQNYPTLDICNLTSNKLPNDLFNADRIDTYLLKNQHIKKVHRHSFYHLAYFTEGSGQHIIDFNVYPIEKGMIYFMRPGQVHNWEFIGNVDGYVVNFSSTFFDQLQINSSMIDAFPFFNLFATDNQVLTLDANMQKVVEGLFEDVLKEISENNAFRSTMIASIMIRAFVTISRQIQPEETNNQPINHNSGLLKQFIESVEQHYKEHRLTKDYASMLFVTANHLNYVCKEHLRMPAGELIRNRVLLEAKRLLVNLELSIANIASDLNFSDTSYFVKFFKKYTDMTPEAFRKNYYGKA